MIKRYWSFINESMSHKEIHEICKKYGIGRSKYRFGHNGVINIKGRCDELRLLYFKKLPLSFGSVSGDFDISHSKLETLEGCPNEVGGKFKFSGNNVTSLEGFPSYIHFATYGGGNKLTSFEGMPNKVHSHLHFTDNDIRSFKGFPLLFPDELHLSIEDNPLYEVFRLFYKNTEDGFYQNIKCIPLLNEWDVIDPEAMNVSYLRLCEVYEELDMEVPTRETIKLKHYTLID